MYCVYIKIEIMLATGLSPKKLESGWEDRQVSIMIEVLHLILEEIYGLFRGRKKGLLP